MALNLRMALDASLEAGLLDSDTALKVRREAKRGRLDPIEAISNYGRIPAASIYQAIAEARGVPYLTGDRLTPVMELLDKIPRALLQRKLVLPVSEKNDFVLVVTPEVDDRPMEQALRIALGKSVRFALADRDELRLAVEQALRTRKSEDRPPTPAVEQATVDPVLFVDKIMKEAFIRRASDIHIEPEEEGFRVRFRIDGRLRIYRMHLPKPLARSVLSRLKVLAGLDIAETREPQDGGFGYRIRGMEGQKLDIRLATAPTRYGERATVRLLGLETESLTLGALGLSTEMCRRFQRMITRPHGFVLITGPTGCGKTTTLYAALRLIDRVERNVLTVEDPIEYPIPGVSQMQVDRVGKVTFAGTLRALLRHDPDVLMVGEIRDMESAEIALRAAMTGHMVFSTLHTNTAYGAVTRLFDMGCEPYLVASTLTCSMAQRLVRRLCPACKRPRPITQEEVRLLGRKSNGGTVFEPGSCPQCQGAGYRGRIAVFEMLIIDPSVRSMMAKGCEEKQVVSAAKNFTTLREDAIEKVLDGATSVDEVRNLISDLEE